MSSDFNPRKLKCRSDGVRVLVFMDIHPAEKCIRVIMSRRHIIYRYIPCAEHTFTVLAPLGGAGSHKGVLKEILKSSKGVVVDAQGRRHVKEAVVVHW